MKIKSISTSLQEVPLKQPYEISYGAFDSVTLFLVELRLENGILGLGSASPSPEVTNESVSGCKKSLSDDSLEYLIGKDIRCIQGLCSQNQVKLQHSPAAAAAIDMALYDAFAKLMQKPLAQLLGQKHRSIATSITVGIKDNVSDLLNDVREYISQGFKILKIKTGTHWKSDLEALRQVRKQVGPNIKIRVDPNQAYGIDALIKFFKASESIGLEFIEQPIAIKDQYSLLELPKLQRRKLALDESVHNMKDAIDVLNPDPIGGIYNIKLMKCGGITPALKIADVAQAYDIDLMWGCMDESIISISAALHVAFCCPQTRYLDLDGSLDLTKDFVSGGFLLKNGMMSINGEHGLGLKLDC